MNVGRTADGEAQIMLTDEDVRDIKEMVRGAALPLRRKFHKILTEL